MQNEIPPEKNPRLSVGIRQTSKGNWYVGSLRVDGENIGEIDNLINSSMRVLSKRVEKLNNKEFDIVKITPDILIKIPISNNSSEKAGISNPKSEKYVALEIENDVHWDFKKSLRKLKRYKARFPDTRVIIPKSYQRFAPFYLNEGIQVYIWEAKRKWQCLKCETQTIMKGLITPKCTKPKCKSHKQNEFRLIGLEDTKISEFA